MNSTNDSRFFRTFDWQKLATHIDSGILRAGQNGTIEKASPFFYEMIEQNNDHEIPVNLNDLFLSDTTRKLLHACFYKNQTIERMAAQLTTCKGKKKWVEITLYAAQTENDRPPCFEGFIKDNSNCKELELKNSLSELIFTNTLQGIMICDEKTKIIRVNQVFEETTGYQEEEVLGKLPSILNSGFHDEQFYQTMWAAIKQRGKWEGEIRNRRKDGELYSQWLSIISIKELQSQYYIGIFSNINVDKDAEKKLSYLAYHDALTGLPNRHLLLDRLEQSISRAHRSECRVAVLFLDLDGFKKINDTYGHTVGDQLLVMIAGRLQNNVRRSDTVSRLGGDEFCIVFSKVTPDDSLITIQQNIQNKLNKPYHIDNHLIHMNASIGISVYPEDGDHPADLIDKADQTMYREKRSKKNNQDR